MERKQYIAQVKAIKDDGIVEGVFATLNVVDLDGDVTLPGAFGTQAVKVAAWGHNWGALPVGRGQIAESGDDAVFSSQFFLDTTSGTEHFTTVKNLAELQEWSYGFEVIESDIGQFNGEDVRFLRKLKVFEVSPVMRGVGISTHTTLAKSADGMTYVEHGEAIVTELDAFITRSKGRSDFREQEDRKLSRSDRERLVRLHEQASLVRDELTELLSATEPEKSHAVLLEVLRDRFYVERERVA